MRHLTTKAVALALSLAGLLGVPAASAATAATGATVTDAAAGTSGVADTAAGLAGTVGSRQQCTGPAVVCPDRLLFGLSTPRALTLNTDLTGLEHAVGHRADLVGTYQDFTEPMYTTRLRTAIASGRTPIVTWEPFNARQGQKDTYPLAKIASGAYDAYLRRSADQAKAVGKPFIVRFAHEMNGFWYPWGQPRPLHPQSIADPANSPAAYVRAYRHVVDVFRARGASNVAWMWSPNVIDANPNVTLPSLYPGDGYVDVIGLSGYLAKPDDTYEARYRPTLDALATIGPTKPIMVAETGVVVSSGRDDQLRALLEAMSAEPRVVGVVYFSQPDKAVDYRIDSDPAAQQAIRTVLGEPRFTFGTNDGAAFATTPVLTGAPRVGSLVSATYHWRGSPTAVSARWLSCPAATTPSSDCVRVGWGEHLTVEPQYRGRYLRAALGVVSTLTTDQTERTIGPVLNVPPAVTPAGVDMLAGSLRLRLPEAPPQTTNWVLRLDGGAKTYLPTSATEQYFNNLVAGTQHTISLAACDCPSTGPETSVSFTLLARPAAPAFSTSRGSYTVTLPDPAPGQTGWVAVVDGAEEPLDLDTRTITRNVAAGGHSFGLRAVSGTARTNATYIYPQVY